MTFINLYWLPAGTATIFRDTCFLLYKSLVQDIPSNKIRKTAPNKIKFGVFFKIVNRQSNTALKENAGILTVALLFG